MTLKRALESSVQLQTFPKSVVEVYVMVLESDGGLLIEYPAMQSIYSASEGELPAAITCASLALADASIQLFDLVTSCAVVSP